MNLDKLRDFLESEEGQESIKRFHEKLEREEKHSERWIEKFKNRAGADVDSLLEKLINKYDSDEYVNREYKIGYEPREPFLWVALGYAEKYGEECKDEKYFNMFTGEAYYIGSYVIQVMHGQGSVIRIDKIEN